MPAFEVTVRLRDDARADTPAMGCIPGPAMGCIPGPAMGCIPAVVGDGPAGDLSPLSGR